MKATDIVRSVRGHRRSGVPTNIFEGRSGLYPPALVCAAGFTDNLTDVKVCAKI